MKTLVSLIALYAVTLLAIPSSAFAGGHRQIVTGSGFAGGHRQIVTGSSFAGGHRQIVTGNGFAFQSRAFFVERPFFARRIIVVERPFVARPFVAQPVIFARPIIVPRREVFIAGGSGFGVFR